MPDPFTGPIKFGHLSKPNMDKADIDWLATIGKEQLNKMFGYNLNPDAGYEFQNIWDSGTQGKPTTLSWYNGLGIENTSIYDSATAELTNNTSLNLYVPNDGFQSTVIDTEALSDPKDTTQQKPYLDSNFKLNLGDSAAIKAADMLGSAFKGQGIGLEDDPAGGLTPVSSFDLRSSLAGRILGGTGALKDTPIGLIGAQQLARALQNNIVFNLQEETIGRINLNPLSLLMGNDLFTPNYEITVPKGKLGKILDFAARVTGFEVPISLINKDASIFRSESGLSTRYQNEELLKFTSAGQKQSLKENLGENKYTPQYDEINIADSGYDSLSDTVEPTELNDKKADKSVIDDNGMVKISPLKRGGAIESDPKKYMLSLENLAWADHIALLPEYEVGPGDLLSGHKGRIMWFPPYDLKITEQVSARWNEDEFIGRGEPIYTYNNTTRNAHVNFKIVVDHSSIMNGKVGDRKNLDKFLAPTEKAKIEEEVITNEEDVTTMTAPEIQVLSEISFYFANASYDVNQTYEDGNDNSNPAGTNGGLGSTKSGAGLPGLNTTHYPDNTDFGLNATYNSSISDYISKLIDKEATEGYFYNKIIVEGWTSSPGGSSLNKSLGKKRADAIKAIFTAGGVDATRVTPVNKTSTGTNPAAKTQAELEKSGDIDPDSRGQKEDRKVVIKFEADPDRQPEVGQSPEELAEEQAKAAEATAAGEVAEYNKRLKEHKQNQDQLKELKKDIISDRFIDEREYFSYLEKEDKFIFESIEEKLKYFHPAFHSTTPEGLNKRLSFLHQCTRQGRSIGDFEDPKNLVFGRPPICILRIGDYFHTKVVITSLNIGYDPNTWDLNKDGIGLQPMIASVDLDMHILGGSSLMGPINRLQNALSFNYYANTEVYDNRSDTIMKGKKGDTKYYILNGVLSQYDDGGYEEVFGGIDKFFKENPPKPTKEPNKDVPPENIEISYFTDTNSAQNLTYSIIIKEDKERKKVKWDLKVEHNTTNKNTSSSGRWRKYTVSKAFEEAEDKFEKNLSKNKYDKLAIVE